MIAALRKRIQDFSWQKFSQFFHRMIGELALISAVLLVVILFFEIISLLVSGSSLVLIWQKGRLSVFPLCLDVLAFALIRFGLGYTQIKKPHWIWAVLILLSVGFELRFVRSVYELWFLPLTTIFLVPLLFIAVRFRKLRISIYG